MGLYYLSTVAYAWMICLSFPCSKTGSVLWRPLRFSHKNDVRFVFTSSCLLECLCLIYVICVSLRIVGPNIYCVVFFILFFVFPFCFVYPMLPVSLDFSFLIAHSVFSNVYLQLESQYRYSLSKSIVEPISIAWL